MTFMRPVSHVARAQSMRYPREWNPRSRRGEFRIWLWGHSFAASRLKRILPLIAISSYHLRDCISTDSGAAWQQAQLGNDQAHYAWRLWSYNWKPNRAGDYVVM